MFCEPDRYNVGAYRRRGMVVIMLPVLCG